jgi:hypothetical protein
MAQAMAQSGERRSLAHSETERRCKVTANPVTG